MTIRHTHYLVAIAVVSWLAVPSAALAGQETLARAKDFYASASYEEALQVLGNLHSKAPSVEATEVATYQVFCLMALGRGDDARHAIEALVRSEPLYHPSDVQASPRLRAFFEDVRRPLLPEIAKQSYARAKDAFDHKDMPTATSGFDRVIALVDEIGGSDDQGVTDLRTLASGFRDLSKNATPPPAPPPPVAAPEPVVPASPPPASRPAVETIPTYGADDTDVKPPVVVANPLPNWMPETPGDQRRTFRGSVDVLIGEDGRVISAVVTKSVHPKYDPMLVKAAQSWKFLPAIKDGKPVRYHYTMAVQLGRT